jgi:hypothetical protein
MGQIQALLSTKKQLTTNTMDGIVKLNVGGQLFVTTRATLMSDPCSKLASAKFDPESLHPAKEHDGGFFLDRDPITFRYVLNYLRNDCKLVSDIPDDLLKDVRADADYFGLHHLSALCDTQLQAAHNKPRSKRTDNIEFSRLVIDSRHGNTIDILKLMKDGWRVEEKVMSYNEHREFERYDFVLSRPK